MRIIASILILLSACSGFAIGNLGVINDGTQNFQLFQSGYLGSPSFSGLTPLLAGTTADDGTFKSVPVSPSDYFSGVAFNLDTNSFSVIGDTVYAKGVIGGGTAILLNTNLNSIFAAFSFTTNSRKIIGAVSSYVGSRLSGMVSGVSGMSPPTQASVQISTDAGATWINSTPTNIPVIVSLFDSSGNNDTATNLIVYGYVAPDNVGKTNDFAGQIVYADMRTGDTRELVNRGGAMSIAANAATLWSQSAAVAPVNLNGNALVFNAAWTFQPVGAALDLGGMIKFIPKITASGSNAYIADFTVKTNLNFKILANGTNAPTVFISTNLSTWTTLAQTTNWLAGGYFYVTAAKPASANAFFKATATVSTNSAAVVVSADLSANLFTGSGSGLTFTNASGKKFSLVVNATTNGFNFVAQP